MSRDVPVLDALLLSTARVATFGASGALTAASGFFYQREERLFVVTSRHVLLDEASGHRPDRIEVELHTDLRVLSSVVVLSILLYQDGRAVWREATDGSGRVDVAAVEVDRSAIVSDVNLRPFTPAHVCSAAGEVAVGTGLLIPGYPLGFYDTVHRLPVVRQACVASAFGVRFQGQGYFLTDARMHRGSSGSPVVMPDASRPDGLAWALLGVHSSRMDMRDREIDVDESLGLNCAWYADVLETLTA